MDHTELRTPDQADRWTWLTIAALTQLRLARDHVADHRLPWQPPLPAHKMTPGAREPVSAIYFGQSSPQPAARNLHGQAQDGQKAAGPNLRHASQ